MSRESPPKSRGPIRRIQWVRWALGACALLVALAAAGWLATPWYVRTKVLPDLWAQYGLTMTAEGQALAVADRTADLHGVRFFDGDEEVLSARRLEARISLRGLHEGRTLVERLVFLAPVVHASIEADGRTNVGDDRGRRVMFRIVDIDAVFLDVETGSGASEDRFGQIRIDAKLEQPGREPAPLVIVYWTGSPGGRDPTFVAHAALTGIELDSFPAHVDGTQRAALGVDHLDLVVSMDVREGVIRRGVAVGTSPERKRPLTLVFGGPFDAPVLDRSSALVALLELPFARLSRVGDVAWETGSAVVGGAIGVVEELVRGDLLGAGAAAAEGLGGGALALGSNALDAIGRAVGLVEEEEARDPTAIHARQRARFVAARDRAARLWARAHPDRDS